MNILPLEKRKFVPADLDPTLFAKDIRFPAARPASDYTA